MVKIETIQSMQAAGWDIPLFVESEKERSFQDDKLQYVPVAKEKVFRYGICTLASFGAGCFFWPAFLATFGFGLCTEVYRRASSRIEGVTARCLAVHADIYYLSALQRALDGQRKLVSSRAKGRALDKIRNLWGALPPLLKELGTEKILPIQNKVVKAQKGKTIKIGLARGIAEIQKKIDERRLFMGQLSVELIENIEFLQ